MPDLGVISVAAKLLAAAWAAVDGIETAGSLREQLQERRFRKQVVKRAVAALSDQGSVDSRAAARLLGVPAFVAFASDPENPARRQALDPGLVFDVVGPGADAERVLSKLANAFCAAAAAEASPGDQLVAGLVDRVDDTVLQVMDLVAELGLKADRAQAALDMVVRRGRTDLVDVLDGDPVVAQDTDLRGSRMASDVTDGAVPDYIPRDIDPALDDLLADALAGHAERFLAVAGGTKTGKSRCLLAALARVAPLHLVLPLRRAQGRDTANDLIAALREDPPTQPWVILVEDLYEHLSGGMNLTAAVAAVGAIEPIGCIVATTSRRALNITDAQRQTDQLSISDVNLVEAHHVELALVASPDERDRARHVLSSELASGAITAEDLMHFPERLAAMPQLLTRVDQALGGLPDSSPQVALTFAACQLSLGRATRRLDRQQLRERAMCIHRHLAPHERKLGPLTNQLLDEAENWAAQRVDAAYALLMPIQANDDEIEILDAILDHVGHQALSPSFRPCHPDDPDDLTQLSAEAFNRYTDTETAIHWAQAASQLDHPPAMFNLGVLFEKRGDAASVAEAEQWYRQAAELDHSAAMSNLGVLLRQRGEEAEQWYRRAAKHDDVAGMSNLGVLLAVRGDAASVAEAEQWYRRAAKHDHSPAIYNLGVLLGQQGEEAEAEQWYRRAAEHDHTHAMSNLGMLLRERGDEASVAEAEQWLRRAAEHDDSGVMSNLGVLLAARGEEAEAEQWWRRAAEHNVSAAMYNLGVLLGQQGEEAEAEQWHRQAAAHGHAGAMHSLGVLLRQQGEEAEAEQWYRRAAEQQHAW